MNEYENINHEKYIGKWQRKKENSPENKRFMNLNKSCMPISRSNI